MIPAPQNSEASAGAVALEPARHVGKPELAAVACDLPEEKW